jgi:hypothetical protein
MRGTADGSDDIRESIEKVESTRGRAKRQAEHMRYPHAPKIVAYYEI